MKILICGDSYAADWTKKYTGVGWPNMLATDHQVTNLAQAGCSEYKILKQLQSVDLTKYDKIIIWHTSPYRIYVDKHPIHYNDTLHKDCDLIYNDIKSRNDEQMQPIVEYFEKYFNIEYANFVHSLLYKEIQATTMLVSNKLIQIPQTINFDKLIKHNNGLINHFDDYANKQIYKELTELLKC